jgi:uncharacterized membrane protein
MLHSKFGAMLASAFNMVFVLHCLFCLYTAMFHKFCFSYRSVVELTVLKQISITSDIGASLVLTFRIWDFKFQVTH